MTGSDHYWYALYNSNQLQGYAQWVCSNLAYTGNNNTRYIEYCKKIAVQFTDTLGDTQLMKTTKVQTLPIYLNHALKHLPQSTDPRAGLGSKYVMAKPAQFVKLSER